MVGGGGGVSELNGLSWSNKTMGLDYRGQRGHVRTKTEKSLSVPGTLLVHGPLYNKTKLKLNVFEVFLRSLGGKEREWRARRTREAVGEIER